MACGAVGEDAAAAYLRRADDALALIAAEQVEIQGQNDPSSGSAHSLLARLLPAEPKSPAAMAANSPRQAMGWRQIGFGWQPQGKCIGWEDGVGGLYLEPEASFAAAQKMGNASGEAVGLGSATLRKRLHKGDAAVRRT